MFTKKTIRDIDLSGKTVLLRADYNVPIDDQGKIASDYRIQKSLPTLKYLLEQNCKIIVVSHLGRPKDAHDTSCSLKPVAARLTELLGKPVAFAPDCIGEVAESAAKALQPGDVLLLENLRYHAEEEKNDEAFAKQLASLAEVFVQDGFGVVHRAHASTDAVTRVLPAVAGLLLESEVDTLTNVMQNPERPLMAIMGGSKISDKIEILTRLVDIADIVVVGGALANTFLLATGVKIGKSLAEPDSVATAKEILAHADEKSKSGNFVFYIPQDGVVAESVDTNAKTRVVDWKAHVLASIIHYPAQPPVEAYEVGESEMILDIGPCSSSFISGAIQLAQTVIWNGNLGVTETPGLQGPIGPFAHGTDMITESLMGDFGHKPFSVIGGGDTAGYIEDRKLTEHFNHVSTGGGASLELMSGKVLPGVAALQDK